MERDQYKILELLGQGATSRVYRGLHVELDREVVVKILKTTEPAIRERFLREAKLLAALHHPGIAGILDFGMTDEDAFMVQPFLPGRTLAQLLEEKEVLDWKDALQIASTIAAGLSAAHAAGIVHRDLKPSNVYLPDRGKPILIDFGLGRGPTDSGLTAAGVFMGTPLYAAPEMVLGETAVPASDLYALGILLHECLTGKNPFDRDTLKDVLRAQAHHTVTKIEGLPAGAPESLEKLILSLIAKKPSQRPESAAEVHQRLQFMLGESLGSLVVPPRRTGAKEASREKPVASDDRRRRSLAGAALGALLVAAAGSTYLALGRSAPVSGGGARPVIRFGRTGVIEARWEGGAPESVIEITGSDGLWTRRTLTPDTSTLTHEGAPPATSFRIEELEGEARRLLGDGRTPEYTTLVAHKLLTMDDRVLVGMLFMEACPLILTIRSDDDRVVARVDVPEVKRKHRQVLEGLSPQRSYRLDAEIPGAWGGFRSYPFRTQGPEHRNELRRATKHDWESVTRVDFALGALLGGEPDVRLVPILKQILGKETDPTTMAVILMRHFEGVFDPRLDDELIAAMRAHPGDHSLAYQLLEVLAWSGASPVLTLAQDQWLRGPDAARGRNIFAEAGLHVGRPSDFETCLAVYEETGCIGEVETLGLQAMDPVRTLAAQRRWLEAIVDRRWSPGKCIPRACALPLRTMSDAEIAALGARCVTPGFREYWIELLLQADTPPTRRMLAESFARAPGDIPLLWAMARIGDRGAVTTITNGLTSARGLLLADSIAVLGLLGARESIGAIERRLTDADPHARRAAAWALGRLESGGSIEKLLEMAVSDRDDHGLAAWALGRLRARETAARLSSKLVEMLVSSAPVSWERLGQLILTLQRMGHPIPAMPGKMPPGAAPLSTWLAGFDSPDASAVPAPGPSVAFEKREIDHFPFLLEEPLHDDVPDAISVVLTQRGGWALEEGKGPVRPNEAVVLADLVRLASLRVDQTTVQLQRPVFSLVLARARALAVSSWPSWTVRAYHPSRLQARGMLRLEASFLR